MQEESAGEEAGFSLERRFGSRRQTRPAADQQCRGVFLDTAPAVSYDDGWTMASEFPSGSRSQNIGGTGSPQRLTASSTSTPVALNAA